MESMTEVLGYGQIRDKIKEEISKCHEKGSRFDSMENPCPTGFVTGHGPRHAGQTPASK